MCGETRISTCRFFESFADPLLRFLFVFVRARQPFTFSTSTFRSLSVNITTPIHSYESGTFFGGLYLASSFDLPIGSSGTAVVNVLPYPTTLSSSPFILSPSVSISFGHGLAETRFPRGGDLTLVVAPGVFEGEFNARSGVGGELMVDLVAGEGQTVEVERKGEGEVVGAVRREKGQARRSGEERIALETVRGRVAVVMG